ISQFRTGQCGDCLVDGFECVLFVWGEACPPCASSCGECTFTNQFLFLETLCLHRDAQCALLSTTKTDPLYCADRSAFQAPFASAKNSYSNFTPTSNKPSSLSIFTPSALLVSLPVATHYFFDVFPILLSLTLLPSWQQPSKCPRESRSSYATACRN